MTSVASKSEEVSERVKVRVAVSPAFRDAVSEETATVGVTVLTENVRELSASRPSLLKFPALSEKDEDVTAMVPFAELLVLGVNVAV